MFNDGQKVKRITDGKIGVVIESFKTRNGIKYLIEFNNIDRVYVPDSILEEYKQSETPRDDFKNMVFSGINDYKRIMTHQRLNGELTNMFYSMDNNLTEYYPHQFLPVTKFLQSPEERILIADEVGLGKTIEAMYIWKELEARRNAKRLLIVCPASLREKWKRDLENLFSIHAEIVKADKLLEKMIHIEKNRNQEQFCYIVSIESIRLKKIDGANTLSKLNFEFENYASNFSDYAFSLTIIDEAHYLRNRETANFKTATRLREISESLILLSATPIQTDSENLYSLMNILSPERFDDKNTFGYMLMKDQRFVVLANCLSRPSSTVDDFNEIYDKYCDYGYNAIIEDAKLNIKEIMASPEKRMNYANDLRSQVFYNNLFNRTRRRFVFTNTATRKAHAVRFNYSEIEMKIYNDVSKLIRNMSVDNSKLMTFALITRQKQMASCLPAAFKEWRKKISIGTEFLNEDDEEDYFDLNIEDYDDSKKQSKVDLTPFYEQVFSQCEYADYKFLKQNDSKYEKFLDSIKTLLAKNSKEKIIIFTYFRGTNEYLEERLIEDGINAVSIKGGMGELKDEVLESFKNDESINILISSEVGAEGLDLQFANVEYNYDLPWNPMKLEQRIGRIDRIGQKSETLRIYNLCCEDTIEDRVLERLYDRVHIFETSIGDMEDIVGQPIQELALEILDPTLTEEDIQAKAEQKIQVMVNQRMMNNRLENESGVLDAYREMILNSIQNAKVNKRCIDKDEKIFLIKDFLINYYPGSSIIQDKQNSKYYIIQLSDDAVVGFRDFRQKQHVEKVTNLTMNAHNRSIVTFEENKNEKKSNRAEFIDLDHPIFDWIRWTSKNNPIESSSCSAITIKETDSLKSGNYVYYIQKWIKTGVEKSSELKYFMINVDTKELIDENLSEQVLNNAITVGYNYKNAEINLQDFEPYFDAMQDVVDYAWDSYEEFIDRFDKRKELIFSQQLDFVNFTTDKKIASLNATIDKLKNEGKSERVIHMNEKRIEKIENERQIKKSSLELAKYNEPELSEVAIGVLLVEK